MKPCHSYLAPLLFALLIEPSISHAQESSADRAAARALANDAQAALEKKDYATAAAGFARAAALVHAPTLQLGLARAEVGLGDLGAAHEVYARIVRDGAPSGAPPAFQRAVAAAKQELAALGPRMLMASRIRSFLTLTS